MTERILRRIVLCWWASCFCSSLQPLSLRLHPLAVSPPLCDFLLWLDLMGRGSVCQRFWRMELSAGGRSLSDSMGWPPVSSLARWRWDGTSSAGLISLNHNFGTDSSTKIFAHTHRKKMLLLSKKAEVRSVWEMCRLINKPCGHYWCFWSTLLLSYIWRDLMYLQLIPYLADESRSE